MTLPVTLKKKLVQPLNYFPYKKMEEGYTVISGYFNDILTKMAFDHKPKSTIKGRTEN